MNLPSDIPLYAYIKRELKSRIENGELPEGARVPSELELARQYGVSRNPTRQALRDLELEGYIVRSPGRGSFVAPVSERQKLFQFNGWRTIALACPELEFHYTRTVIQGFIQTAAEKGFQTMVYFVRFSNAAEIEFLADIRNSGIDGIAFWLQHDSPQTLELLQKFRKSHFPFVLVDRYVRNLEADYVVTDNEDMIHGLTCRMIDLGHKNIGFATAALDNTSAQDRFDGYRRALADAGLPYIEELVGVFPDQNVSARNIVNRVMAHRQRPSAFVCSNDGAAAKLLDELTLLGYTVPDEIALATVDDNELCAALGIPMVTAMQAGAEMGRASAELLLSRIADPLGGPECRLLKARIEEVTEREAATQ